MNIKSWVKIIVGTTFQIIKSKHIHTRDKLKAIIALPKAVKKLDRLLKAQKQAREHNPDEGWKDQ